MRGFHCLVMFFGLLLVAGSAVAEKKSTTIAAQTRLVLVSSDTWLYSAPDEKSYRFRVRGPMPKSIWAKASRPFNPEDRLMRTLLFVMQGKVPDKPGWLHLRSLADPTQVGNTCAHPTPGRGLVLDLYVRSDRLLGTLKKPFQASYEDGTELHLLPGVLIRSGKYKGRYIAETPFLQVELALPPNATTQSFAFDPNQQVGSPLDNFLCIHHEFFADKDYTLCFIHEAEEDR